MRAVHRWGVATAVGALALLTPYAGSLRPTADPQVATSTLVALVRASESTPYSGTVEVKGRVGLPIADHFSDVADLFGGDTRLRVWWRGGGDWRVDRLLDTGEVDLFHQGVRTTEWDYERQEARVSTDPAIRLPRDSDLLPPEVARRALDGIATGDVTRLGPRRIAGVDAAGLRVPVDDPQSTLRHVDLWVDPATGVTLSAEVYGDASRPAVGTTFTSYSPGTPASALTVFHPAPGVVTQRDDVLDIADAANQFAPVRAPATLAGFAKATGSAAAVYGTGLTRLLVIPLRDRDAYDLAHQLEISGGTLVQGQRLLRVGPLGLLVTAFHGGFGTQWVIGGTVTDSTLLQAAHELAPRVRTTRITS